MDRKQNSSLLDVNETSARSTAADRRASLLRRQRQPSQELSNQNRSRSGSNGQESQQSFEGRGKSISQVSASSQEYVMRMGTNSNSSDAQLGNDYCTDHESDVDSEGHPRSRRSSNVEEDVCYPFHSQTTEKSTLVAADDINLYALYDYLQTNHDQDINQNTREPDWAAAKSGKDFNVEDLGSRAEHTDGWSRGTSPRFIVQC
ncbi:hypothetical protein BGW37DRAFT_59780 [Umbelopsis sp. PMI_123]|nr:hypothetical protein BGW37DRAFT_59780 [Umbelopsis sp. PMI_123]